MTCLSGVAALATCQDSRIKEFNFHIVISFKLSDRIEKKKKNSERQNEQNKKKDCLGPAAASLTMLRASLS